MAITVIDQSQGLVSIPGTIHEHGSRYTCTAIVWFPGSPWNPVKNASNKVDFVDSNSKAIFKTAELYADFLTALTPAP